MADEIFRKKSLERIQSPEALNDYVRVANPGIWLLLGAIIVLLIGFCTWGVLGRIETRLPVQITVSHGTIVCTAENTTAVKSGMQVEANGAAGTVTAVHPENKTLELAISLPDGVYAGEVITESLRPLSFLLN